MEPPSKALGRMRASRAAEEESHDHGKKEAHHSRREGRTEVQCDRTRT
jgi:hypothetical protein